MPRSKKIFTILKSPHVNKTAQDQFEFVIFSTKIDLHSFKISKFLLILKKINLKLFPDVKIKINFFFDSNKSLKTQKKVFDQNKFLLKTSFTNLKVKSYLKLLDLYGEVIFKTLSR